jgi:hypothetical protein
VTSKVRFTLLFAALIPISTASAGPPVEGWRTLFEDFDTFRVEATLEKAGNGGSWTKVAESRLAWDNGRFSGDFRRIPVLGGEPTFTRRKGDGTRFSTVDSGTRTVTVHESPAEFPDPSLAVNPLAIAFFFVSGPGRPLSIEVLRSPRTWESLEVSELSPPPASLLALAGDGPMNWWRVTNAHGFEYHVATSQGGLSEGLPSLVALVGPAAGTDNYAFVNSMEEWAAVAREGGREVPVPARIMLYVPGPAGALEPFQRVLSPAVDWQFPALIADSEFQLDRAWEDFRVLDETAPPAGGPSTAPPRCAVQPLGSP